MEVTNPTMIWSYTVPNIYTSPALCTCALFSEVSNIGQLLDERHRDGGGVRLISLNGNHSYKKSPAFAHEIAQWFHPKNTSRNQPLLAG
jgi:hypothetical protein